MNEIVCLNDKLSTTKLLSKVKPCFELKEKDKFDTVLFLPGDQSRVGEGGLRTKGYFKYSYENKPLISIVTIVYNGEAHLEETILSVLNQDYDNVEYIVIDGDSTDGTINILKKYEDSIDYWISERDEGISDAFNKGIRCATGKLIGLINADDYYEKNAFTQIVNCFLSHSTISDSIIYGNTNKVTVNGIKEIKKSNNLSWCISVPFSHCSSFLTSSYYKKYGLFDTNFKIGMDVELLMRGLKRANYLEIDDYIATQRDGGVSDTNRLQGYTEYRKISKTHFGLGLSYLGYIFKLIIFYKNKVL